MINIQEHIKNVEKMKEYIVQCLEHYPGYETFVANSIEEARLEVRKWKGCQLVGIVSLATEELRDKYSKVYGDK